MLLSVVELRWDPRGPGPPERPGGPRETSVLRGFKGACKRPLKLQDDHPLFIDALLQFASVFFNCYCSRKTFWSPEMWLLDGPRGLKKFSRLAIARHALGPLITYALVRPLVTLPHPNCVNLQWLGHVVFKANGLIWNKNRNDQATSLLLHRTESSS